jgi:hypothetical protein
MGKGKQEYAVADFTDPATIEMFGCRRDGKKIVVDDKAARLVCVLSDEQMAIIEKRGGK